MITTAMKLEEIEKQLKALETVKPSAARDAEIIRLRDDAARLRYTAGLPDLLTKALENIKEVLIWTDRFSETARLLNQAMEGFGDGTHAGDFSRIFRETLALNK